MNINWNRMRIFIKPGATDMRKQINGLSIIVEDELNKDSLSGNLFLFCNRRKHIIKSIYWDKTGFCLWQKRLECDRFPWPEETEEVLELSRQQLFMLLSGIDFFRKHKELHFKSVL